MSALGPILFTVGAGVVVLGVLIFVHEFGHFLAAKSVGVAVLRFSFGFGPRTPLRATWGGTEYCVSWVPLGGYVKMAGLEEEGAAGSLEGPREGAGVPPERTFDHKPLWARVWIISAGVLANTLFAVAVYAFVSGVYGVREDTVTTVGAVDTSAVPLGASALATMGPGDRILRINGDTVEGWGDVQQALLTSHDPLLRIEIEGRASPVVLEVPAAESEARQAVALALRPWRDPVLGQVDPGGRGARGGLRSGDRVLGLDGVPVRTWDDLVAGIEASPEREVSVLVRRGGADTTLAVTPRGTEVRDPRTGVTRIAGKLGIGSEPLPLRRYGPVAALGQGFVRSADAAGLILYTLKGLLLGRLSPRDVGGPILVGQISGQVARLGWEPFLGFLALFSINLAILNLLPIPVLDGGHLVFLAIEAVRRRPVSETLRARWTQIGFAVLVAIMLLALANDVLRVFR